MISKVDRHEAEIAVFSSRHEAGILAVRDLLYLRQGEINKQWPSAAAEDVPALQGEARLVARLIKLIEQGPSIKESRVVSYQPIEG